MARGCQYRYSLEHLPGRLKPLPPSLLQSIISFSYTSETKPASGSSNGRGFFPRFSLNKGKAFGVLPTGVHDLGYFNGERLPRSLFCHPGWDSIPLCPITQRRIAGVFSIAKSHPGFQRVPCYKLRRGKTAPAFQLQFGDDQRTRPGCDENARFVCPQNFTRLSFPIA